MTTKLLILLLSLQIIGKAAAQTSSMTAAGQSFPTEITVTGSGSPTAKIGSQKPPLEINVDPFETIRKNLKPDPSLLLAVSPLTVSWQRTHPEFLDDKRVIEPWRTSFGGGPGIVFHVRKELDLALGRHVGTPDAKRYGWTLTIADEAGQIFYRSGGPANPPAAILWSGQNDQDDWIKAGHSYSAVYSFTDSAGSPYTITGKPLLFHGIIHQENTGLYISLDSGLLFGKTKADKSLEKNGLGLLRSAADLIKRRYSGIPLSVHVYAATPDAGQAQAGAVAADLEQELMMPPENIRTAAAAAPFSEQRVEIVVLNR
ncbi:MAG: hypothetical protein ACYCPQ_05605 [Elusimicrobiota bacterium]